ncbi:hypothetical protein CES86_5396 [Brucella lupini]|uniref:Uncharacterized protein n=1 Tax=Brucella lupini TaxID=255457 RepID=A0A256H0Z3_9HYPH|nr:hypothetical protein CES86_5396 [Brucella lupini]
MTGGVTDTHSGLTNCDPANCGRYAVSHRKGRKRLFPVFGCTENARKMWRTPVRNAA